jgi:ABC-2 type transport system ATP-binding protein
VDAVSGVSLEVRRGEIFGFLGPNGAGKTTTIKMLMGLIAPSRGTMAILGTSLPAPAVMARVGFLPENPYVYPYLTAREFVSLCGRVSGLGGREIHQRVGAVLDRLGVGYAADRAARTLSKGMLQRVGLAAALVHEPDLLVLDEPMSGLDPIGRKEVRDLLVEEKSRGRKKGQVVVAGSLSDLLARDRRRSEVAIAGAGDALRRALEPLAVSTREMGGTLVVELEGDAAVRAVVERAFAAGARLESVTPKRETLENLFVREVL